MTIRNTTSLLETKPRTASSVAPKSESSHPGVGGRVSSSSVLWTTGILPPVAPAIWELHRQYGIPRRGHTAIGYTFVGYESNRARPQQRKPRARKQSGRNNIYIAGIIAAPVRNIPSDATEAGRNHLADPPDNAKKGKRNLEKVSQRFQTMRKSQSC